MSTVADWRARTDPEDLREYDRFGPWIDVVEEPVDMPRRFRPWWPELSQARYLLKVPRSYDRAQVRPGMDLYESVIAVFADRLCILRAEPAEVVRQDVGNANVVASIRHTSLLVGRWTLLLDDASRVEVGFNAGSQPVIAEVDQWIFAQAPRSARPAVGGPSPRDHFFRSTILNLNSHLKAQVRPVHVEEPGQPCRNERGGRRRSAGMMALATSDDLFLFNQGVTTQPLLRRQNFTSNIVRVPFRTITSYEVRGPQETTPPGFSQLVLTCGEQVILQPCLARPAAVESLLAQRAVPSAG